MATLLSPKKTVKVSRKTGMARSKRLTNRRRRPGPVHGPPVPQELQYRMEEDPKGPFPATPWRPEMTAIVPQP